MAKPVDVSGTLDELDHPLRADIDEVRALVMGINPDISEQWKWNAPTFSYGGDYLFTFHLRPTDYLHLVVHHPDAPSVASELLEGDYKDGRRMIFLRGHDDVQARRDELERVIRELVRRTRER
ncbi:DUF1801 domain-containing protein [Glaciihabitans sp. dw_435]|uniref:DUF1801 domain-containing protein n=1 Tax=Glaciihabitans sp. dw_435 TaxID=2720081 RepID=UPI001BD4C68C|nr:DUF1801 domain-containing protein [Glaciihabitans sp. dw_435]